MSSLFYGLEIAKTGLAVSQQGISLTGHNIANANTVGFTRQRIIQNSIDPSNSLTRISKVNKGTIGGGVAITMIDQVRSDYLDRQYRAENATLGNYTTRAEEIDYLETVMNELSTNGLSASMADFFNSLSELGSDPVNDEIRTSVQQNAQKMIESFHHYYNQLTSLQDTYNENMNVTVTDVNNLLTSIASYNEQISGFELSGEQANDLRDKRNLLLDDLSQLINIDYHVNADNQLIVTCEGTELINHTDTTLLETSVNATTGFYDIFYEGTTTNFDYNDGKLMAYKNLRDGSTSSNVGIPYILNNLNRLAKSLAEEFNDVHETGYTKPIGAATSQTNIGFFEVPAGGYTAITAGNLSLSAQVLSNVRNIAASSVAVTITNSGNNEIALQLAELSLRTDMTDIGNFEEYLNSVVVELGIQSSTAQTLSESQQAIVDNLAGRKESISGVSLDEEMIQMMTYQHAYSAASRVLSALDEALEILINRTGKVGL
jgi:flagellar hook-associated protein 1 FlgK